MRLEFVDGTGVAGLEIGGGGGATTEPGSRFWIVSVMKDTARSSNEKADTETVGPERGSGCVGGTVADSAVLELGVDAEGRTEDSDAVGFSLFF